MTFSMVGYISDDEVFDVLDVQYRGFREYYALVAAQWGHTGFDRGPRETYTDGATVNFMSFVQGILTEAAKVPQACESEAKREQMQRDVPGQYIFLHGWTAGDLRWTPAECTQVADALDTIGMQFL
ncbi:hypothetical protein KIPB_003286 [Kipferlia bialata]|uniref:Uncharacterized protein n=1 Tax=Kipferlia bialata TaxID=797122 RepID=A0A9K3CRY5_9EUKA|nr:hypothetical protein KIPB_003286 [Kipferlia bialata]|eukprot:g3286.t1